MNNAKEQRTPQPQSATADVGKGITAHITLSPVPDTSLWRATVSLSDLLGRKATILSPPLEKQVLAEQVMKLVESPDECHRVLVTANRR